MTSSSLSISTQNSSSSHLFHPSNEFNKQEETTILQDDSISMHPMNTNLNASLTLTSHHPSIWNFWSTLFHSSSSPDRIPLWYTLIVLWFWSMLGTFLRLFVSQPPLPSSILLSQFPLFAFWSNLGALIFPQLLGCFFMGGLCSLSSLSHLSSSSSLPLFSPSSIHMIGLTTGLCGSLTTFSGVLYQCVSLVYTVFLSPNSSFFLSSTSSSSSSSSSSLFSFPFAWTVPYTCLFSCIYLTLALSMSFSSFQFAYALTRGFFSNELVFSLFSSFYFRLLRLQRYMKYFPWTWISLVAVLSMQVGLLYLFISTFQVSTSLFLSRSWSFSLLISPWGTTFRYMLATKWFHSEKGIFIANTVAVLVSGSVAFLEVSLPELAWFVFGVRHGFCGTLSTMSSWISILIKMPFSKASKYFFLSIVPSLFSLYFLLGLSYLLHS